MDVLSSGAGLLRSTLPWLAGHLRSPISLMSSEEVVLVVPLGGVGLYSYGISTAAGTLAYLFLFRCPPLCYRARTLKTNMDLLVAGLQGVDPYGLYQYSSLVDRKRKDIRSVAPSVLSPISPSIQICSE